MRVILTNNATFEPFTFDELLKPLSMYTTEYNAVEEGLSTLGSTADLLKQYAMEDQNSEAFKRYNQFTSDLDSLAETMASSGLSAVGRKHLLNMTKRYASEISPIETAVKNRAAIAAEQRKLKAQKPTLMFDKDFSTEVSVDDMISNPNLGYTSVDGEDLYKAGVAAAKAFSSRRFNDSTRLALGTQYYQLTQEQGVSEVEAAAWLARKYNIPELDEAVSRIQKQYNTNSLSDEGKLASLNYTISGIMDGLVYDKKVTYQANRGFVTPKSSNTKGDTSGKYEIQPDYAVHFQTNKDKAPEFPKIARKDYTYKDRKEQYEYGLRNSRFSPNYMSLESEEVFNKRKKEAKDKIDTFLYDIGYSKDEIEAMTDDDIESALKKYNEGEAKLDMRGRNTFRINLDPSTTEDLLGSNSGFATFKELSGFEKRDKDYRFTYGDESVDLKYEEGKSSMILTDPVEGKFILRYNGNLYEIPADVTGPNIRARLQVLTSDLAKINTQQEEISNAIEALEASNPQRVQYEIFMRTLEERKIKINESMQSLAEEMLKKSTYKNTNK